MSCISIWIPEFLVNLPSCSALHIVKWTMLLQAGVTGDPKVFLAFASSSLFVWLIYTICSRKRSPYPLPPGPPEKFLVGNLGQLSDHPEQDYLRWGKEYSEFPSVRTDT